MICSVSLLHHIRFNEDQKHVLFMLHMPICIVAGQYIILLRQYLGSGSRTDLENSAGNTFYKAIMHADYIAIISQKNKV